MASTRCPPDQKDSPGEGGGEFSEQPEAIDDKTIPTRMKVHSALATGA